MIKFVKEIIRDDYEVTEEVNNLISIAYKNVISANRSAWRAVANLEQKEKEKVRVLILKLRSLSNCQSSNGIARNWSRN